MRALALLLLVGCARVDPWGELSAIPPAPAPERPMAAPELRGRTLTISQCLAAGLERNPRTRAAWLASKAAAARVGEEKAPYLPAVDAVAGLSRTDAPELRDAHESPEDELRAGFTVRQVVYDGAREARVRTAGADLRAAVFLHHATLHDTALEIELAYAERLAAKALVRVAEDALRSADGHSQLAKARQAAGVAAKFDVLKAATEKAEAELALVRARSGVRVSQGRLCRAMGLRVTEDFDVEELPAAGAEEAAAIDRLLEEALRNRPELRAASERIESRRADVALADSGHLPVISAGAVYGWVDREFGELRKEWTAGIGVTLPLFAGFGPSYRGGRARAELARAQAEEEALARDVELEAWTEHARLAEARDAVEAARRLVDAAEEGARAAEGRYKAGTGSIIELADSLRDRTLARARLVQAELDRASARVRFERALGRRSER